MSENQLINTIRDSKRRGKLWDKLTNEDKRDFIMSLDGDDHWLDRLLEDFVEAKTK